MKQISENVYLMLQTSITGCSLGLITTKEGNVMVDSPWCPSGIKRWRDAISTKGKARYLINTDEHLDHNTGNSFFPEAITIAHEDSRIATAMRPVSAIMRMVKTMDPSGLPVMEGYQKRLHDITITDKLTLHLGGQVIELINLPGHANGVIGVYIPKERVIFVSDNVFYKEKTWLYEATPELWVESLKKIRDMDVDIIVPGHGDDVCGKEYLDTQIKVIQGWMDAVKSAAMKGLNVDEAIASIQNPDLYPLPDIWKPIMSEERQNSRIITRLYNHYLIDSRLYNHYRIVSK